MQHATVMFFFFNDTATTEIYTLSLHDALPILSSIDRIVRSRVGFFCVQENLDCAGPVAQHFMMSFVQAERHFLAERAHAGFEAARARSAKLGRPRKQIDAAMVQADYDRGFSLRECARLHWISHTTVIRILHDQGEK